MVAWACTAASNSSQFQLESSDSMYTFLSACTNVTHDSKLLVLKDGMKE